MPHDHSTMAHPAASADADLVGTSSLFRTPRTPRAHARPMVSGITPTFALPFGALPTFNFNSPFRVSPLGSYDRSSDGLPLGPSLTPIKRARGSSHSRSPPKHTSRKLDDLPEKDDDVPSLMDNITSHQRVESLDSSVYNDSVWSNVNDSYKSVQTSLEDSFTNPKNLTKSTPIKNCANPHKRRKGGSVLEESPNNSMASRIDSVIETPARVVRKLSHGSIRILPPVAMDGFWNEELDDVLIKCLHKYNTFKKSLKNTSVLRRTTQNRVLARMLHNKVGIVRTPKEIASRLLTLHLQKGIENSSDERFNGISTPAEDPSPDIYGEELSESDSAINIINADIDKELELLLSSSPLEFEASKKRVFQVAPDDFKIDYSQDNYQEVFTKLDSVISSNSPPVDSILNLVKDKQIQDILRNRNGLCPIPLWLVDSKMTVTSGSSTESLDLLRGRFLSLLSIKVLEDDPTMSSQPGLLSWNSLTRIYDGDKIITENVEAATGFSFGEKGLFNMHLPFMKNFWSGYLSLLRNGSSNIGIQLKNLKIVQVLYSNGQFENHDLDLKASAIHLCIVYSFEEAPQNLTTIKMFNSNEIDEQATEPADSSPLKVSQSNTAEIKRESCDTPIFNAQLVSRYNGQLTHKSTESLSSTSSSGRIKSEMDYSKVQEAPRLENVTNINLAYSQNVKKSSVVAEPSEHTFRGYHQIPPQALESSPFFVPRVMSDTKVPEQLQLQHSYSEIMPPLNSAPPIRPPGPQQINSMPFLPDQYMVNSVNPRQHSHIMHNHQIPMGYRGPPSVGNNNNNNNSIYHQGNFVEPQPMHTPIYRGHGSAPHSIDDNIMRQMPLRQLPQNYSPPQPMPMSAPLMGPPAPLEGPFEFPVKPPQPPQHSAGHRRLVSHQIKTTSNARHPVQGVLQLVSTNCFPRGPPHGRSLSKHEYEQTWNLDKGVHFVEYNPASLSTSDKKRTKLASLKSSQIEGPASKENIEMRTGVIKLGQFLEYHPASELTKAKHVRS